MADSPNPAVENPLPQWVLPLTVLLTVPAFLLGLTAPFIGPDEPRYAEVGREMWQSGDWITPTLGGFHWFEKPPLLYWLEAVFYSIFGVNEFAARLGPSLCGLGIVACVWLLGRRTLDKQIANWFAIVAASTLGVIAFSHAASTDIVVTLPMTVAMSAFFVFDRALANGDGGLRLYAPLAAMYAAAGVALLAKGLIGIIFPPLIIALYYLLSGGWPPLKLWLSAIWGIPLTLAIAAIWYVPMYQRYGDEFINEFIIRHHFERFTTNVFQHPQPWYYFFLILPLMTLPWFPLFFGGLWRAIRVRLSESSRLDSEPRMLIFALCWLFVPLLFFSASTSKLPGYVLPALPPAILIAALGARSFASKRRIGTQISACLAVATLLIVSILLVSILPARAREESMQPLIEAANEHGLSSARVLLLHSFNFGAEFYAQGRFDRDETGKQVQLFGAEEVRREIQRSGGVTVLVVVPKEYVYKLTESQDLDSTQLAENKSDAIFAVSLK